jgi:hypothetical protein
MPEAVPGCRRLASHRTANRLPPLLAPHRAAFAREDEKLVGHGGITVEEVIVPLVRIERK